MIPRSYTKTTRLRGGAIAYIYQATPIAIAAAWASRSAATWTDQLSAAGPVLVNRDTCTRSRRPKPKPSSRRNRLARLLAMSLWVRVECKFPWHDSSAVRLARVVHQAQIAQR